MTDNIIVAFPKIEDARSIKQLLVRNGYNVVATCQSGAYVTTVADRLESGIVICGYKLTDMLYDELKENIPKSFQLLLITSPRNWEGTEDSDIVFEAIPLNVRSLLDTVEMMFQTSYRKSRKKNSVSKRSARDKEMIGKAKQLLMDKNGMTEEEAHRYIQKRSMETGNSLAETAEKVLIIYS